MSENKTNANSRIARNMMFLYTRMTVVTLLSLITIKYTLQILGIEDYGIYNVVGGVVTFLTFVNATMSSAAQRFLAFDLGRDDSKAYNNTFNALLIIFFLVGIFIFILFEIFTQPLIYEWLKIPEERQGAAEIVYHLSVLSFIFNLWVTPFISGILANERMGIYAYIAIADTVSKLFLLLILIYSPFDKLITYAFGFLIITATTNLIYVIYNQRKIKSTRIYFFFEKKMFYKLVKYIGWSFFGSVSAVMCNQGLSILMNLFFGVTVNAAKAISDRVMGIIQSFTLNFYMAVSPQIFKSYAAGEHKRTTDLAFGSTRLAFYLMFIIIVPAIISTEDILKLWLSSTCTEDMVIFTQLSLIFIMVNVFETPITFMIRATGDIKKYQIYVGSITLLIIPVSYILYLNGYPAYTAFICEIVIYAFVQIIRILVAKNFYKIGLAAYFKEVLLAPLSISTVIFVFALIMQYLIINRITLSAITLIASTVLIWFAGLKDNEKIFIKNKVSKILCKK